MIRKAFGVLLVLTLVCAVAAAADFSGTWARDKDKSDPMMGGRGGRGGGGGGGGAGGGQPPANIEVTLVIKHSASELAVTRNMTRDGQEMPAQETKYKLDGSMQTITMGRGELKASAKAAGDTVVIEGTQSFGDNEMKMKEVYSLEGGTLVVTSTRSTPNGERTTKQVYNKK